MVSGRCLIFGGRDSCDLKYHLIPLAFRAVLCHLHGSHEAQNMTTTLRQEMNGKPALRDLSSSINVVNNPRHDYNKLSGNSAVFNPPETLIENQSVQKRTRTRCQLKQHLWMIWQVLETNSDIEELRITFLSYLKPVTCVCRSSCHGIPKTWSVNYQN